MNPEPWGGKYVIQMSYLGLRTLQYHIALIFSVVDYSPYIAKIIFSDEG